MPHCYVQILKMFFFLICKSYKAVDAGEIVFHVLQPVLDIVYPPILACQF